MTPAATIAILGIDQVVVASDHDRLERRRRAPGHGGSGRRQPGTVAIDINAGSYEVPAMGADAVGADNDRGLWPIPADAAPYEGALIYSKFPSPTVVAEGNEALLTPERRRVNPALERSSTQPDGPVRELRSQERAAPIGLRATGQFPLASRSRR